MMSPHSGRWSVCGYKTKFAHIRSVCDTWIRHCRLSSYDLLWSSTEDWGPNQYIFWNPLGRHFVWSLRESIHERLHVVLTRKYIYIEKLPDIYTSNCLKMTQHLDIYLLTFWTYILPFGYKYYNLDIYIAVPPFYIGVPTRGPPL